MKKLEVLRSSPSPASPDAAGAEAPTSAKAHGYWPTYWRSLEHKSTSSHEIAQTWREFREDADVLEIPGGVSRRRFFGIMGASAALAGVTTGCVRKPVENIMPFSKRPEDIVPGDPIYYATAFVHGGAVEGLLVESQDGRPTKIEGNPKHGGSHGATSVWAQASVLDLYDPDRTRVPLHAGELAPLHTNGDQVGAIDALRDLLQQAEGGGGAGLGLVLPHVVSPTQRGQLQQFRQRFPQARIFVDDPAASTNAMRGAELVGGEGARARLHLDKATVVVAADADILGTETESVRLSREWARSRRIVGPTDAMSRLYVVEPHLTGTGVMADHRRRVKGSQIGGVLLALARELEAGGFDEVSLPPGASFADLPQPKLDPDTAELVKVLARDLASKENLGRTAIVVGERQPPWVHALGYLLNTALRNIETGHPERRGALRWRLDAQAVSAAPLSALAEALRGGAVKTVVCVGSNPAYDAPGELGMPELLGNAEVFHVGMWRDETARLAAWHLPMSHYLEAWGDAEASDGTVAIQQPLIAPLHGTYGMTEILGLIATGRLSDGYTLVKSHWGGQVQQFSDQIWRQWLHDGVASGITREAVLPALQGWDEVAKAATAGYAPIEGLEIDFHRCPKVSDGRFSNNAWMQELPHPITKIVWDNAAYLSPTTARANGVGNGDFVTLTVDGRPLQMPIWVLPGQADDTVSVALGYGRQLGQVADEIGFDANALRGADEAWFAAGSLQKGGGKHALTSTQDHGTMVPHVHQGVEYPERPIVLEVTRDQFKADPNFVERANLMEPDRLEHLWEPPALTGKQQWGMSVDLNTCTGCNACVVACQAENNIPVVGKKQVGTNREMHWMRIDRYFRGSEDEPTAVLQPMFCQHCEAAPCETVCPVAATTHSPEGLNDMAYNRCIGTRYCSNNCPYKVRRFNFFNYNLGLEPDGKDDPDGAWLAQMQKNPDVTVRFRGVIEKCTYCVQRIQGAKIEAHVAGKDTVEDGKILTACQQVCPTEALVFGDIKDPNSKVSRAKRSPRDYTVLRDLNNRPRTTYLARVRNPHPELESKSAFVANPADAGRPADTGPSTKGSH
jgi:MoCo/4Fe-4S cofactor protein with predicted Tat translocation signal